MSRVATAVAADPDRVIVFDTTLRDGEQAPGFSMSPDDKVRMAHVLAELKVDVIEAGFAAASPGDEEGVRRVVGEVARDDGPVFCSLSRAQEGDIDAAWRALNGTPDRRLHIFLGSSPSHRQFKLKMTTDQVLAAVDRAVRYGRTRFDDVEFSPEDAIRTEPEFLAEVCEVAAAAGLLCASRGGTVWEPAGEPGVAEEQAAAIPPLQPAQQAELEKFIAAQQRVPVMVASEGAAVVLVKFNDYMCPPCGQTFAEYKPVLAKWAKEYPGKLKFVTKDYPLDPECNQLAPGGSHMASCEAAVAVRLAREKGKAAAMEDWLFANQPSLTPASVKTAVQAIAGVTDFDARYQTTLQLVKGDIAQGGQLQVQGTPTFFLNGIRLPGLRASFLDAAIALEMKRAGVALK